MTEAINNPDFDSMLDGAVSALPDAPIFKAFPRGTHHVIVNTEIKPINGVPAVMIKLSYLGAVDLVNPDDVAPEPGAESGSMYMLFGKDGKQNDMACGLLKQLMIPVMDFLIANKEVGAEPEPSLRTVLNKLDGLECHVETSLRKNKKAKGEDAEKEYLEILAISPV